MTRLSMLQNENGSWHVAVRFALGASLALGGAVVSAALLMRWLSPAISSSGADITVAPTLALSGRARLALIALVSAAWFFVGGSLAGGGLRPAARGRLGVGIVFLLAGALLTFWLLGMWIGIGAPWRVKVAEGLGCALIWTGAGVAGGLILRDEIAPLRDAIIGFGLGGLIGGASVTAGLFVLAVSVGQLARVVYLLSVVLACVLPPFIAGAVLGRPQTPLQPSLMEALQPR